MTLIKNQLWQLEDRQAMHKGRVCYQIADEVSVHVWKIVIDQAMFSVKEQLEVMLWHTDDKLVEEIR